MPLGTRYDPDRDSLRCCLWCRIPKGMLSLLRLSTSHFAIPTALLYGWLPLSSPAGASQASTGDVGVPGLSKTWAYQNGVHHIEHPISEISHKRLDNKKRGTNFRKQAFYVYSSSFVTPAGLHILLAGACQSYKKRGTNFRKQAFYVYSSFFVTPAGFKPATF